MLGTGLGLARFKAVLKATVNSTVSLYFVYFVQFYTKLYCGVIILQLGIKMQSIG